MYNEGEIRRDSQHRLWIFSGSWEPVLDEKGNHTVVREARLAFIPPHFSPKQEKELRIKDKRSYPQKWLDNLAELEAIGQNERLHLLDRIDAYLKIAQLTYLDRQRSYKAVRAARDLIRKEHEDN